ncbi:hypothetical protein ISF_06468 [Cordyceps fumosorosea ARSEF 2679]|uniref:Uncharacterized protein n=1 Tax=Cordyceps fumosorosea (strain ARSEF 2679) TaxID=1081104 RepID=A0A167RKH9_CORFA|nr:hypothetical protein ISF_06468 [Cordyceps fumosorosea ARSEF 2679]OAA58685.1 hypothetical protein ISF_06468 [Cordyceps fumosorosea ARSEF 2679]
MITPDKIFAFIEFLERAVEIYENFSTAGEQIQAQRSQLQFIVLQRPVWLEYLNTPNFFRGLNQTQESLILEMMQTFGNDVRELERQLNQRQLDLATWWGMAEWYWRRGQDAQKIDSLFMTAERLNEIFSDRYDELVYIETMALTWSLVGRATLWMVTNMRDQIQQGGLGPGNGDDGNDSDGREYDYGSGSDSGHSSDGSDGDDSSHNTGHNIHRGDGADGNSRSNHRSTKTAESVNEEHEAVIVSHKLCQSLCSSRGFLLLVAQASSLEELWSYGCRTGPVEGSGVPYEVVSLAKDLVKASGKDSWTDYTVQQWLSMGSFYLAEVGIQQKPPRLGPTRKRLPASNKHIARSGQADGMAAATAVNKGTAWSLTSLRTLVYLPLDPQVVQEALDICDFWFGVKPRQEIINDIRTCIRPSGETSEIDAGDLWRFRIAETVGDSAISPVPLLARRVLQGLRVSKSLSEDQGKQICEKATVVLPRQDDHECYSDRPLVLACVCGKHLFRYYITEFTDVLAVRSVHVDVSRLKVPGGSTESIRICCEDEQLRLLGEAERAAFRAAVDQGWIYIDGLSLRDACVTMHTKPARFAAKPIRIDSEMIELSKIRCEERGVRISLQLRFHTAEEARGVFEELIKPIE